jgi:hypothetical protein
VPVFIDLERFPSQNIHRLRLTGKFFISKSFGGRAAGQAIARLTIVYELLNPTAAEKGRR